MQERAYQEAVFWTDDERVKGHVSNTGRPLYMRRLGREWLRQGGKTSSLGRKALKQMMRHKGRLITFLSASLNIGAEFVEKEARTWTELLGALRKEAAAAKMNLQIGQNAGDWKPLPASLDWEALGDIMEQSRFEFRLYHSRQIYSRTKVIAPNIATARGWTGTTYLDEAAFVRDLQLLIQEIEPMFSTDPTFSFEWCTTPPSDRAHYANKLITPADGRDDFPLNAAGNWYKNKVGMWVHRVTIDDAALAGRRVFDPDTGDEQTIEANRSSSMDIEGWDRSNRLIKPLTGTSAISDAALNSCLHAGHGRGCIGGMIDCSRGKGEALNQLQQMLSEAMLRTGHAPLTLGHDIATTEKKTSNPSSLAMMEQSGMDYPVRFLAWWKTANEEIALALVQRAVEIIRAAERRPTGLHIDASNEVFHAQRIQKSLRHLLPVRLHKGGTKVERSGEETDLKTLMGNQLVAHMESTRIPIPHHPYIEADFARVIKKAGRFDCAVGSNGEHGDTFDAVKLALYGQTLGKPGEISAAAVGQASHIVTRSGLRHPLAALLARRRAR